MRIGSVPLIVTNLDIAPTLKDVRDDLEALLDFTITRWSLNKDVINTLKEHDKIRTLKSVRSRFYSTENYEIKSRSRNCANVLDSIAAEW